MYIISPFERFMLLKIDFQQMLKCLIPLTHNRKNSCLILKTSKFISIKKAKPKTLTIKYQSNLR